ncbi:MAG: septum formation initiator family protein [Bacteroidota bacterium]|nr:septum formation initiator family protein [Bacteroidota bacterium]MEC9065541.1 septum formation initiator family protein [Bacteroidota bacterium]|tara:strand:+ start:793 stop:1107 length:315 start_codon:yes stop_codon:yes gene_type:complete
MSNLYLKIKEIIKKPYFKYVIITVAFIIWMTFLDTNSFQIHNELNNEIDMLEKKKKALIEETEKDKELINKLSDIDSLEHFARENYNLKKENEQIFIIEYEEDE